MKSTVSPVQTEEGGKLFFFLSQVRSKALHQEAFASYSFLHVNTSFSLSSSSFFCLRPSFSMENRDMHGVESRKVEWSELLLSLRLSSRLGCMYSLRDRQTLSASVRGRRRRLTFLLCFFIQMLCRSSISSCAVVISFSPFLLLPLCLEARDTLILPRCEDRKKVHDPALQHALRR